MVTYLTSTCRTELLRKFRHYIQSRNVGNNLSFDQILLLNWTGPLILLKWQPHMRICNDADPIMKTIRHWKPKWGNAKTLSFKQCILIAKHLYTNTCCCCCWIKKNKQQIRHCEYKVMTGNHMVINVSRPTAFKVTYKLRRKKNSYSSLHIHSSIKNTSSLIIYLSNAKTYETVWPTSWSDYHRRAANCTEDFHLLNFCHFLSSLHSTLLKS